MCSWPYKNGCNSPNKRFYIFPLTYYSELRDLDGEVHKDPNSVSASHNNMLSRCKFAVSQIMYRSCILNKQQSISFWGIAIHNFGMLFNRFEVQFNHIKISKALIFLFEEFLSEGKFVRGRIMTSLCMILTVQLQCPFSLKIIGLRLTTV